jgi:predicted nucleotidyltransferase
MNQELTIIWNRLRELLPALREQYGVESLAIFGSYIHGTQRAESDLDILVTFLKTPSLIRLIEIENNLADILRVKVDLVPRTALKPHIGARILREIVPV